jgi:dinuclear metal center YbgI/SA1388 family protein
MPELLRDVLAHLDATLEIGQFRDYAPNGLQVEGRREVRTVVTGVSASAALLERAVALGADLVVVHHGLIWGGGLARIDGPMARRLKLLLANDISLAAYHLPLDKHPRLGNNAGLADALGLGGERSWFGDVRGVPLGLAGRWAAPLPLAQALERVSVGVCQGTSPRFAFPHGPAEVRRVGLCTGAASDLLEDAARAGCDLFVTGELAERAGDLARELEITLVAAGHYATEIFGPMRIADELARVFPAITAQFVPSPSPL